ncbi:enoyl-CoA hydratase/isomerase family protein [Sphingobacterium faecale]|uniref:Enoyl-CoA hydratase/isomerase family protein n=1 Tax=Sphingobacterium faecale TaxID=2803775 RepID=A0ABS1R483_9SPHI|nr:enoyl-CoA hydratase/isomerase family protein [Sphingobacterium faecale]MBL1409519.1 enoyl-CoA hydratase/isomerase family protein [Sphingobacterium faecale]
MDYIRTRKEDHILHILLDRGRSNAMDVGVIKELIQVLEEAKVDPSVEGVILSGKESFFSSGLDLITLFAYNEEEMRHFWTHFMKLLRLFVAFEKPTVAAITGHSPAGGCVMALCCDYRVMAEGDYIVGLNEVPVGIVVPESIFILYSFWLGRGAAYRSLLEGRLFKPQEALSIGLVDEVVPFDRIQISAIRRVKSVMQFEKNAWRKTKLNLRGELIRAMEEGQEEAVEQVLEQWWKPSTRDILKTIIHNLTQKR